MRLHLIDGTYELFRAHFSKRPGVRLPDGRDRKAVAGMVSGMLTLLDDSQEAVTHAAVAFDRPIRSFRNDLFDGYKTDDGVPPELLEQFEPAEAAARAVGLVVWRMDEFEADDALATAAARFAPVCEQIRILTPDKDLLQCLRGERVVRVDRLRNKVATEASLRADKGLAPTSIPDYLALVGDTADGIPGLNGFGERTAATLLGKFPHLEDIPRRIADWNVPVRGAGVLAQTLFDHWDAALLYRRLATLREDVPLPEQTIDALAYRGAPRSAFAALCAELSSESLASRPTRWAAP